MISFSTGAKNSAKSKGSENGTKGKISKKGSRDGGWGEVLLYRLFGAPLETDEGARSKRGGGGGFWGGGVFFLLGGLGGGVRVWYVKKVESQKKL